MCRILMTGEENGRPCQIDGSMCLTMIYRWNNERKKWNDMNDQRDRSDGTVQSKKETIKHEHRENENDAMSRSKKDVIENEFSLGHMDDGSSTHPFPLFLLKACRWISCYTANILIHSHYTRSFYGVISLFSLLFFFFLVFDHPSEDADSRLQIWCLNRRDEKDKSKEIRDKSIDGWLRTTEEPFSSFNLKELQLKEINQQRLTAMEFSGSIHLFAVRSEYTDQINH